MPRYLSLLLLLVLTLKGSSQNLYLGWKRPADLAIYTTEYNNLGSYHYSPFRTFNFYLEKPLQSKFFSVGMEMGFSNYHPEFSDEYKYLGDNKQFYDRCYSVGFLGRLYTPGTTSKGFVEVGGYVNYLQINQPIVVETYYGRYERFIRGEQFAYSVSMATGLSIGTKRIRWEPYAQLGFITDIKQKRNDHFATSSIGIISHRGSLVMSPFNFKVMLD